MAIAIAAPTRDLLGPDDLIRDLKQLPSSPAVLPQLMALLNDPSTSLEDVVDLIQLDAGMAARMLQVANSAYYGRGARCEVIQEAVNRIGFLKTYELVSFASAGRLFLRPLTTYGISADELWRRSVVGAIASALIAARCELDTHLAYTAGLLHVIGLVAIDAWVRSQENAPRIRSSAYPKETTSQEVATLGFTNASVAAALLRSWKFPDALIEPVRWQFEPSAASARNQPIACVLSAAKWLRDAVATPPGSALPQWPDARVLKLLGLAPAELESLIEETRRAFGEATQLLEDAGAKAPFALTA